MKDLNELRAMEPEALQAELLELRKEQFNLRMKKSNGVLDKPHLVSKVRRAIARIKTVMTEKAR